MNNKLKRSILAATLAITGLSAFAQHGDQPASTDKNEIARLKAKVENAPDSLTYQREYIKAVGIDTKEIDAQYAKWIQKYPKSDVFPFALGEAFTKIESPKAKPFLLEAVKRNPKNAKAWGALSEDSQRWGDFNAGEKYLQKAMEADPTNSDFAFRYTQKFSEDWKEYQRVSLDYSKRFPENWTATAAILLLGIKAPTYEEKIKYLDMAYRNASIETNPSAGVAAFRLFNALLEKYPQRALDLARELSSKPKVAEQWLKNIELAEQFIAARNFLDQGKGADALPIIEKLKFSRYVKPSQLVLAMKAEAIDETGNTQAAYDTLLTALSKNPKVFIYEKLSKYASKLSKSKSDLTRDIISQLTRVAQPATDFSLKRYVGSGNASLKDFQGKAVLLTYWFPGCGPCRGEFPHFQRVVNQFGADKLAYIGLNIAPEQNEYVVPFLKQSGYSFQALEDVKGRKKGNLDNRTAAPVNFIIDGKGRILFSNFMIDDLEAEADLKLMIDLAVNSSNS